MEQKISELVQLLEKQNELLAERERQVNEKAEELEAQKEELTAAIEELVRKNNFLNNTLAELQERNEELDQLVYRTSHDLKTPITSSLGLLNLLDAEVDAPSTKEYSKRIRLSMQMMEDVLRSIALFTKAALDEIQIEPVNINALIQKVWGGLSYVEGFDSIRIECQVSPSLSIQTDSRLLAEALKAVLINAIQYRVHLNPSILIQSEDQDQIINVLIEDNGEGMTKEVLEKACTIFYRGSEKSKGSGLGLYMTKKILNRLGGNLSLISLEKGLRVSLNIPKNSR